jgi:single-stranded-DNA-specific exonuclease
MAKKEKKWKMLPGWKGKEVAGYEKWLLSILANRGINTKEEIEKYLDPKYEDLLSPDVFTGILDIAEKIIEARDLNQKVVIYGDYDVDGVTSTALMYSLLNSIGVKNLETYIPHREEEGYGLNEEAVAELIKKKTDLIITVDCGITSKEIIDRNADKIDFIVIDHHEIMEDKKPQKALTLHPSLVKKGIENLNLSACGTAFFLAKKMTEIEESGFKPGQEKWFLDLVALSTICDVVPLIGQNRILAKFGLLVLSKTKRIGIEALASVAQVKLPEISAYEVGFLLGPRINASGRLEHAKKSLELLLTTSKPEAMKIAADLNEINQERQKLCQRILNEAKAEIESSDKKEHEIFLLSNKNWPRGVVGIIASKLTDAYSRPVIIFEHGDGEHHGSARSIDALDITESLAECEDCLIKFGGHAKAAGLSVSDEKWIMFNDKLLEIVRGKITKEDLAPIIKIDTEIKSEEISAETIDKISALEPFGFGNPNPAFAIYGAVIDGVNRVGKEKEHLKFKIAGTEIGCISFSDETPLKDGDVVDIAGTLRYNIWNDRKSIELRILDIK